MTVIVAFYNKTYAKSCFVHAKAVLMAKSPYYTDVVMSVHFDSSSVMNLRNGIAVATITDKYLWDGSVVARKVIRRRTIIRPKIPNKGTLKHDAFTGGSCRPFFHHRSGPIVYETPALPLNVARVNR